MNSKNEKQKNGAGFYIALCCCVAVIGLVGYVGNLASKQQSQSDTSINSSTAASSTVTDTAAAPTIPQADIVTIPEITPPPTKTTAVAPTPSDKAAEPTPSAKKQATPKPAKGEANPDKPLAVKTQAAALPSFAKPLDGNVIKSMSDNALEYNSVLGDWRAHNGTDYSAAVGSDVHAVCDGKVIECFSGTLGETVILDCDNGINVVYGCLAETENIQIGQKFKQGDVIAKTGTTGAESTTEPHVHIEIIKDGTPQNPETLINAAN